MTGTWDPARREEAILALARARRLRPPRRSHLDRGLQRLAHFFAAALFREETAGRPGLLQRVDARARLLAVLLYLVSLSLARSLPALLIHALLPPAALALSRIRPREFLGSGFLAAVAFTALMAAPATLNVLTPGTLALPLFSLPREWRYGPYALPAVVGVTREGLWTAATLLLRVSASVAGVLWLTLTTRWVDLLRALRFLRVPPLFLQVAGMTVRYLHALLRQTEEVHLGKKARTVCRPRLASEQAWVGSRLARSWERSLHLVGEVGEAMTARGFRGEMRFPAGPWLGAREWGLLVAVGAVCLTAHLV